MVRIAVRCPYCHSDQIIKRGKTDTAKQRYRCQNPDCPHQSFVLDPAYKGRLPAIKQQVIEMSLNASGVRDTARVLKISTDTVIKELKKRRNAHIREHTTFARLTPERCRRRDPAGRRSRSR